MFKTKSFLNISQIKPMFQLREREQQNFYELVPTKSLLLIIMLSNMLPTIKGEVTDNFLVILCLFISVFPSTSKLIRRRSLETIAVCHWPSSTTLDEEDCFTFPPLFVQNTTTLPLMIWAATYSV